MGAHQTHIADWKQGLTISPTYSKATAESILCSSAEGRRGGTEALSISLTYFISQVFEAKMTPLKCKGLRNFPGG